MIKLSMMLENQQYILKLKSLKIKNIFLILTIIIINGLLIACKKNEIESLSNGSNISHLKNINDFSEQINGEKYTKLGIACKENKLSSLKKLLTKGADINLAKTDDIYEFDALYVAIENNSIDIVKYLSQNKIDFNKIYTEEGLTPVALAVKLNKKEILDILIQKGSNVNAAPIAETDYKYVPLLIAVENNNYKIAKTLIDNGADINISDDNGNSVKKIISKKGKEWNKLIHK